jgi:hypothetical protein
MYEVHKVKLHIFGIPKVYNSERTWVQMRLIFTILYIYIKIYPRVPQKVLKLVMR